MRTSTLPKADVFSPIRISDCAALLTICATCTGPAGEACACPSELPFAVASGGGEAEADLSGAPGSETGASEEIGVAGLPVWEGAAGAGAGATAAATAMKVGSLCCDESDEFPPGFPDCESLLVKVLGDGEAGVVLPTGSPGTAAGFVAVVALSVEGGAIGSDTEGAIRGRLTVVCGAGSGGTGKSAGIVGVTDSANVRTGAFAANGRARAAVGGRTTWFGFAEWAEFSGADGSASGRCGSEDGAIADVGDVAGFVRKLIWGGGAAGAICGSGMFESMAPEHASGLAVDTLREATKPDEGAEPGELPEGLGELLSAVGAVGIDACGINRGRVASSAEQIVPCGRLKL